MSSVAEVIPFIPRATKMPSEAAALVAHAREQCGYNTVYDKFLCGYIGSGEECATQAFRPICRMDTAGKLHRYNNPRWHLTGFTPQGYLIDVRWSQDYNPATDPVESMLHVATADLCQGVAELAIRHWRVDGIYSRLGRLTVSLEAAADVSEANTFAFVTGRAGSHANHLWSQLVFDSNKSALFYPEMGGEQQIHPARTLMDEVESIVTGTDLRLAA